MQSPLRQRANWTVVIGALIALAALLLCSPYYQGLLSLQLAWDHGRFVPIEDNEPFPPFGGDFLAEWTAGQIIREGNAGRLYDGLYVDEVQHDHAKLGIYVAKTIHLMLFYPPAFYLLVTPLSLLPIQLSAMLFCCLMALCLIGAAAVAAHTCPDSPRAFAWILFVSCLFFPVFHSLNTGQKGTLWLVLFTAVFALLHGKRSVLAGLVFGLVALKPPLALALGFAMLVKGQWRFLAGCAVSILCLAALSFTLGTDACRGFVDTALYAPDFTLRPDYPIEMEQTWFGFFAILLRGHADPWVIKLLAGLAALASLVALWWLLRGPMQFGSDKFTSQFAGIMLATVLVSPKLLMYDLTIVLLPIFLLARLAVLRPAWLERYRRKAILAAAWLFIISSSGFALAYQTGVHFAAPVLFVVLIFLSYVNSQDVERKDVGISNSVSAGAEPIGVRA